MKLSVLTICLCFFLLETSGLANPYFVCENSEYVVEISEVNQKDLLTLRKLPDSQNILLDQIHVKKLPSSYSSDLATLSLHRENDILGAELKYRQAEDLAFSQILGLICRILPDDF